MADVANALYRAWGIGQKKSNEGALLLLARRERKSRLEIGHGLEPILPDGFSGSVLREMRPALRENH
ncbi:MAG: TPM domain-containing protein [Acidobacteria bacterium]|nr:TPM domain-containing protein [Acidobacteriota bacterium]